MKPSSPVFLVSCVALILAGCRDLVLPEERVGADDGTFHEFWFAMPDGSPIRRTLVEFDDVSYVSPGQANSHFARYTDDEGYVRLPRYQSEAFDVLLRPESFQRMHPYLFLGLDSEVTRRELRFPGPDVEFRIVMPEGLEHLTFEHDSVEFEREVVWPGHDRLYPLDFRIPLTPTGRYSGNLAAGLWRVRLFEEWEGEPVYILDRYWYDFVVPLDASEVILDIEAPPFDVTWQTPPGARCAGAIRLTTSDPQSPFYHEWVPALDGGSRLWASRPTTIKANGRNGLKMREVVFSAESDSADTVDLGALAEHEVEIRFVRGGVPLQQYRSSLDFEDGDLAATTDGNGFCWYWIFGDAALLRWIHPDDSNLEFTRILDLAGSTSVSLEIDVDSTEFSH